MCAGNYANQKLAFKGQVVESINTILQHLFEVPSASENPQAHGTQLPQLTAQESCISQASDIAQESCISQAPEIPQVSQKLKPFTY